ncbi:Rho guanine nucleotide exchange factor, partial [Marasmius crinis-equi]
CGVINTSSKSTPKRKTLAIERMSVDPELKCFEEELRWIFQDKSNWQTFLQQNGSNAQYWLDVMQQLVDYPDTSPEMRPSIFSAMLRLSKNSGLHPKCLAIQNVKKFGEFPIDAGGFGEVWKGTVGESTQPVCLKIMKIYRDSDVEKTSKEYLREAILWRQLKHPNVLPFLGIYQLEQQQLCLISPWMQQGNLLQFLRATRRKDVDYYTLVYDVAAGLSHLHTKKIVHSDLKGVNILMTDSLRACLGDFGLSRVADTRGLKITSTTRSCGTGRWLAPELLLENGGTSKASDIYAYGCVCYEIFTGQHPFPELPNEAAVALAVNQGKRPARPKEISELADVMWALMETCWHASPSSRPDAAQVVDQIVEMNLRKTNDPAPDWNESLFTQVWANVEYCSLVAQTPSSTQGVTELVDPPATMETSLTHGRSSYYDPPPPYSNPPVVAVEWPARTEMTVSATGAVPRQSSNDGPFSIPAPTLAPYAQPSQSPSSREEKDIFRDDRRFLIPHSPPPENKGKGTEKRGDGIEVANVFRANKGTEKEIPVSSLLGRWTEDRKDQDLHQTEKDTGFRSLWKRLRPQDRPQDKPIMLTPTPYMLHLDEVDSKLGAPGLGNVPRHSEEDLDIYHGTQAKWTGKGAQKISPQLLQSQLQAQAPVQPQRREHTHGDSSYDSARVDSFHSPHRSALAKLTGGGADKDKDHHHHGHTLGHGQKERERSQSWQRVQHNNEEGGELIKAIGFLTATASEDWALVLDVCERASASDANAKEAIRALRREFKYGQPQAQLSAARLWAIMLRNSSDTFISLSTSRKFLDTIEDLLLSSRTNPVVKERVLNVLAAAAYASGNKKDTGFRGLWKKVKPRDKPDEGIPFDTDDAMFNPPVLGMGRASDGGSYIETSEIRVSHSEEDSDTLEEVNELGDPEDALLDSASDIATVDTEDLFSQTHPNRPVAAGADIPNPDPQAALATHLLPSTEGTQSASPFSSREITAVNEDHDSEGPLDPSRDLPLQGPTGSHKLERGTDHDHRSSAEKQAHEPSPKRKKRRRTRADATRKIIPPEEDMRRLFQECVIGKGNADILSQTLEHMPPKKLLEEFSSKERTVVQEFRSEGTRSQEFIAAQIPWAVAVAERSRREAGSKVEETKEERLLGELLAANEALLAALGRYEDYEKASVAWRTNALKGRPGEAPLLPVGSENSDGGREEEDGALFLYTVSHSPISHAGLSHILSPSDTPLPKDHDHISFDQNEIIDILDREGDIWPARKADGTFGHHETASSAVRNLNGYEVGGRPLRIDLADSDPFLEGKTTVRGELVDGGGSSGSSSSQNPNAFLGTLPNGIRVPPGVSALDMISTTLATMNQRELMDVLAHMKAFVITHPDQARNLLIAHPQLAYALFQALLLNKIVDSSILHRMLSASATTQSQGQGQGPPPQSPTITQQQQYQPPAPGPYGYPPPPPGMYMPGPPPGAMFPPPMPPPPSFYRPPPPMMSTPPPPQKPGGLPTPASSQTQSQPPPQAGGPEMTESQRAALMQMFTLKPEDIERLPENERAAIQQLRQIYMSTLGGGPPT